MESSLRDRPKGGPDGLEMTAGFTIFLLLMVSHLHLPRPSPPSSQPHPPRKGTFSRFGVILYGRRIRNWSRVAGRADRTKDRLTAGPSLPRPRQTHPRGPSRVHASGTCSWRTPARSIGGGTAPARSLGAGLRLRGASGDGTAPAQNLGVRDCACALRGVGGAPRAGGLKLHGGAQGSSAVSERGARPVLCNDVRSGVCEWRS